MTVQDKLIQTVSQAKCWVACKASELVNREKYGDDIVCCEKKMFLMQIWIRVAEEYNCQNFDDNGNITADYACLTQDQIIELLGKMKTLMK
jgi:hypothetical protein